MSFLCFAPEIHRVVCPNPFPHGVHGVVDLFKYFFHVVSEPPMSFFEAVVDHHLKGVIWRWGKSDHHVAGSTFG